MPTWQNISWTVIVAFVICPCANANADESYYKILEIEETATQAQIKRAYRLLKINQAGNDHTITVMRARKHTQTHTHTHTHTHTLCL